MPAVRTGTPSQVDASGGNGSTSVTVPTDATAVVAFWAHWDGNAGSILSSLTLDSVAFTIHEQLAEGAVSNENGVGVATLVSPATGSRTLAWTWSAGGARSEGGEIILVYVKGVNLADPVRDTALDAAEATDNVSVTLTTQSTDLVLAFGERFTGGNPALDGTVFINNATLNSHVYDVSQVTAGASSTTIAMTNESWSCMAGIALKEAAAAASLVVAPYRAIHMIVR